MRARIVFAAALFSGLAASPAFAVPYCTSSYGGYSIQFGIGGAFSKESEEQSRISTDTMRLRRIGVDVQSLDYWNGCIRAWVRKPGGGLTEEFYDPSNLRPVY
jgi:hypothetical protein